MIKKKTKKKYREEILKKFDKLIKKLTLVELEQTEVQKFRKFLIKLNRREKCR